MLRRLPGIAVLTVLVLTVTATAALGHASFREQQVPADTEQQLTLRVPGERAGETTVEVEVLVPTEFEVVDCPAGDGWTCETADDVSGTIVTWTHDAGVDDAGLALDVRTSPAPGTYRFPTIQIYDSGTEVAWVQEDAGERPAPTLEVAAGDAEVIEDPEGPDTAHGDGPVEPTAGPTTAEPTSTPSPGAGAPTGGTTPTIAPASPGASVSPAPTGDDTEGSWVITVVLVLAILAAAVVALWIARRRRPLDG